MLEDGGRMSGFDEREYNTVVLAALLHVDRSRSVGDMFLILNFEYGILNVFLKDAGKNVLNLES